MSSVAAREARRKAILSRGSDRLSKLTSSARGENHPAYTDIDSPVRKAPTTETFVGDESIMPTPPTRGDDGITSLREDTDNKSGPTAWSVEEQQEFMRALMHAETNGASNSRATRQPSLQNQTELEGDNPMAAMFNALNHMYGGQVPPDLGSGAGGVGGELAEMMKMMGAGDQAPPSMAQMQPPTPPSLYSKLRPLVHLIASWVLLAFFAFSVEPQAYSSQPGSQHLSVWDRWAELGWRSVKEPFGIQPVPFFWAFVTLQLALHSFQVFSGANPIQPPALVALALPHLPSLARSVIINLLTYGRMLSMLLDDLAVLIFGVGLLIWISSWVTGGK